MIKKEYTKEKISQQYKTSMCLLNDIDFKSGQCGDDFIKDQLTYQMTAFIYSNTALERDIEFTFRKPTFLEWLFGKQRKEVVNVKVKDLLKYAPKSNEHRVFIVNKK